ncbi:glycoside hydrolase [Alicyclobacillus cycloheptanicus]|nr:glycosyl hydrolase family 18 protein [Alicyclobacillus cycloheptanicus]WDM01110.1 glycoside hydrolase [Alicyclobacillus cycloheptanicus]
MRQSGGTALLRRLASSLGFIGLLAGCLASLFFLYGGPSWQAASETEASSLSAAELGELIGTPHYTQSDQAQAPTSIPAALAAVFRVPLTNPLGMLTAQFPATTQTASPNGASESSLLSSLSTWETHSNKIALGWLPLESPSASIQTMADNPGINVVSPEWMTLWSADGNVETHVEPEVVRYAHQHHIQVWAMFDNQFSASLTHAVLSSSAARAHAVQLVTNAVRDGQLDGVNVDFENLESSDQAAFTSFVAQLHQALAPLGAKLSVDITPDIVPLEDDAAYFHAGLASVCDDIVVMAYDEHWAGDTTPGPVADVPWVTRAVDDLLDTGVPADQLILGIPSYTRFWHVYPDGSVTSEAVADSAVSGILASHHASSTWNNELGLYYARYAKPEGYEEVWYAGPQTWSRKLNLVNQEGLGGVAVWSLSLSNANTWSTVVNALRQSLS